MLLFYKKDQRKSTYTFDGKFFYLKNVDNTLK